jgi:HK97 family phage prohead protease/HK97 family phage major capsid protein
MDSLKDKILHLSSVFTKQVNSDESGNIESISIEGYANTNAVDRQGDIIPTVVWEAGLENYLKNPIMLAYHDHGQPIGRMTDHKIDTRGLWIKASISSAAEDVFNLVKAGVLTAFSVGFRIKDAMYDSVLDLFIIKELELLEISVVSVPANQDSLFSLAKSFDNDEDYKSFKSQYVPEVTLDNSQDTGGIIDRSKTTKGITKMDEKEIAAMVAKAAAEAVAASDAKRAEAERIKAAADAAEKALSERVEAAVAAQIKTGESGAEKLLKDIEARLNDSESKHKSALEGLEATIKEKAAELEAIQKSKMSFNDKGNAQDAAKRYEEIETAVLLSVFSGKSIDSTKYGQDLRQKAGAHVPGAIPWELEVSLNMEADIRRRLVVAPIIKAVNMKTNVMKMPLNPDAGVGTWITNAQFGTAASSGTAQTHQLQEITLSAYKVATLEYLAYEEEEDSLLILLPVIRDAMIRRVARAVDIAYLRGAGSGADPVKGISAYATGNTTNSVGTKVTVAQLRDMRKNLGTWGLDPSEVTFVITNDVYYDLLEDPVFQTMNQVGVQATLLTGQIGQIGNSPVLLSGEFAAKAIGAIGAVAINTSNFIAGNQRGLRFDTQDMAETQRRVLVASLRTGLTQLTTANGQGVSKLTWAA